MKTELKGNYHLDTEKSFSLDHGLGMSVADALEFVNLMVSYTLPGEPSWSKLSYHTDPKPRISLEIFTKESYKKYTRTKKSSAPKSAGTSGLGTGQKGFPILSPSPDLTP